MNAATPTMTLEAVAAKVAARLKPIVQRLPMQPPAMALSAVLNRVLLARLPQDAREALSNRTVEVCVTDIGLVLRLQLDGSGFKLAPAGSPVVLRIAADGPSYWRLIRGEDDADRLFFERALVMEGDTEMGLVLKNTLDAIGPLLVMPRRG